MATRFYLTIATAAAVNPAFDAGWEQTGQADRVRLLPKIQQPVVNTLVDGSSITIPITTTQDILYRQYTSDPFPSTNLFGTVSLVVRVFQNATTNNATLAVVVKLCDQSGGNLRTLFSTFSTDTAFPVAVSAATRIVNAQTITSTISLPGDRLVVEVGAHAAAPSVAGSFVMRNGNSNASDFALTSGLTTDLNPWIELSANFHDEAFNNYRFVRVGNNMSTGDKIR